MLGQMKLGTTADTEGRTADIKIKRVVTTILVSSMYHHSPGETFDDFLFFCVRDSYK
jgi:hypothetical protein